MKRAIIYQGDVKLFEVEKIDNEFISGGKHPYVAFNYNSDDYKEVFELDEDELDSFLDEFRNKEDCFVEELDW